MPLRAPISRPRRTAAAVALATALLAAGCGGSDEGSDPPDAPAGFFGVAPQTSVTPPELERMADGGIGTIRVYLSWSAAAPEDNGEIEFGGIDSLVLAAADHGIEVFPYLYGTPEWVAEDLDGHDCAPACDIYAPSSDEALERWREFAAAAAERYGPDGTLWRDHPQVEPQPIRHWQVWNEQNSPSFYAPEPDIDNYAKLLQGAAEAIREHDPDAEIVLGGMFGTPLKGERPAYTAWELLAKLYEDGADEYFDGVAMHPYGGSAEKAESQTKLLHDEVEKAGDDASLWITEIGWSSDDGGGPQNKGPEGQAAELTDIYERLLELREDWNIESVVWYSWRDATGPGLCEWCGESGLFEEGDPEDELEPKPSWDALTALTGGS